MDNWDNSTLIGATVGQFGTATEVYDDCPYGRLYILRTSIHTRGIVRAASAEEAIEIGEEEWGDAADLEEYESDLAEHGEDSGYMEECYRFTNGGRIICPDLNGEYCDTLTLELAQELNVQLEWSAPEDD